MARYPRGDPHAPATRSEPAEPNRGTEKAGATAQEYGNLSVEGDAEGTVDPADLAGTGGPEDDGGPVGP